MVYDFKCHFLFYIFVGSFSTDLSLPPSHGSFGFIVLQLFQFINYWFCDFASFHLFCFKIACGRGLILLFLV